MPMDAELASKALDTSGYPFQLAIEAVIQSDYSSRAHGWNVLTRECPIVDPVDGRSKFIDLIVQHDHMHCEPNVVIECKRLSAEHPSHLQWTFIENFERQQQNSILSCLQARYYPGKNGNVARRSSTWNDLRVGALLSHEAEFCVMGTEGGRNTPLLESIASDLLNACDGYASRILDIGERLSEPARITRTIFPVIVTNASLMLASFDPSVVDIKTGLLDRTDLQSRTVPYVRFRKSFSARSANSSTQDIDTALKSDITILVVNSLYVSELFRSWVRVYES